MNNIEVLRGLVDSVTDYLCEQEYDIGGREELRKHVASAVDAALAALEQQPEAQAGGAVEWMREQARKMRMAEAERASVEQLAAYLTPYIRNTTPPAPVVPEVVAAVLAEVERAMRKFPTWPTDPLHAVAVLGEEFGELTKAVLQSVYEPHKSTPEDVATEAIQTAAMAIRFLMSLDAYLYERSFQHSQTPPPPGGKERG